MNDFDFEELDKAVNTLATKTQDDHAPIEPVVTTHLSAPAGPEPVPERIENKAVEPASSKPQADSPDPITVSTPERRRLTQAQPQRGRGSFMDIVPPAPRKPVGRVGVSVQPVSKAAEVVPDDISPAESEKPEPEISTPAPLATFPGIPDRTESQAEKPDTSSSTFGFGTADWPDPLDFGNDRSSAAVPQTALDPKPEPATVESEPEVSPATEPVSPFLSEAKVEKRPLGAFSNFKPAPQPEPFAPQPVADIPELHASESPEAPAEPEKAPLPPKKWEVSEEKEEPTSPDLHGKAMMTIPEQYHAEAKPTDTTQRPVYDTKEYHPPLLEATSHDRHGSSMWTKLFIALVTLAILAAAGYFAYVYFVQQ